MPKVTYLLSCRQNKTNSREKLAAWHKYRSGWNYNCSG